MLLAVAVASVLAAATAGIDAHYGIAFSGSGTLGLDLTVDGRPAETGWVEFLDKMFDHLDRNGNGSLSPSEVGRLFPLPLSGRQTAPPDFARTDANRDGEASRIEFREFYRSAGFTPVAVEFQQWSDEVTRAGSILYRALDRDGDGRLSREELKTADRLVRRFDEDDDETLTSAEILASDPEGKPPAKVLGLRAVVAEHADAVLRLPLGKNGGRPDLTHRAGSVFGPATETDRGLRFRFSGGVATAVLSLSGQGSFAAVRSFYLAQFQAAATGGTVARKSLTEGDPSTAGLSGLFDHADRDVDGTLTLSELDRFLDLIELGVRCRPVVRVEDWGRNPFTALDENEDGRLTLAELRRAAVVIPPDGVPHQVRIVVGPGPVAPVFGPVFVSVPAKRPVPVIGQGKVGPRWFRAMDRNGDGVLSPSEFTGNPEHFRRLDADGDGQISEGEVVPGGK